MDAKISNFDEMKNVLQVKDIPTGITQNYENIPYNHPNGDKKRGPSRYGEEPLFVS